MKFKNVKINLRIMTGSPGKIGILFKFKDYKNFYAFEIEQNVYFFILTIKFFEIKINYIFLRMEE